MILVIFIAYFCLKN